MLSFRHFRILSMFLVVAFHLNALAAWQSAEARQFDDPFQKASSGENVTLTADFKLKPDSRVGYLNVHAKIQPGYHVYSITQPKGGPIRSQISVTESDQFSFLGDFVPDQSPTVDDSRAAFNVNVESHKDKVTWVAPFRLAEGVDPQAVSIRLSFNGQICEVNLRGETVGCMDISNSQIVAKFSGFDEKIKLSDTVKLSSSQFTAGTGHLDVSARIVNQARDKSAIQPGDTVKAEFTATPRDGFHIYQYSEKFVKGESATLFSFNPPKGWSVSTATASDKPYHNQAQGYWGHKTPVTWSFDITIPSDVKRGSYEFPGVIGYQTCTDDNCDAPAGHLFRLEIPVSMAPFSPHVNFVEPVSDKTVKDRVNDGWAAKPKNVSGAGQAETGSLGAGDSPPELTEAMASLYDPNSKIEYILYEEMDNYPVGNYVANSQRKDSRQMTLYMAALGMFLGGFLLNLMPCVFPVLGLKVMGFVEQSGSDPGKIRMHGVVFSLGLLISMWILAGIVLTLKVVLGQNVSWGAEQFGNPYFVFAIIVLLFLLGLNMAGVFELGTTLTRVGGSVDNKKGYSSSFLTGILTTIIATPCAGPFLGTAMGYTLSQSVQVAMLLFTIFGLGIALPYIVLSFFPALISALPRPGAWMHTFKVIMAFAMFAMVAFFMKTFGVQTGVDGLSWLAMSLVVIALAAFFYGTWSPAYVQPYKRLLFGWILPALVMGTGIWMGCDAAGYQNTAGGNQVVDGLLWNKWQPGYIEHSLKTKPKIIWVDYTAEWCFTCKTNKKIVFSNAAVKEQIEKLGVELVKVDYTDKSPEITTDLQRSDQSMIPVNLIYPPNYPREPAILHSGIMTPGQALKMFERMETVQKWIEQNERK
jgi:thiol:disulfide interchange protein